MTMSMVSIFCAVLIVIVFILLIIMFLQNKKYRQTTGKLHQQIKVVEGKLQFHTMDIDNLIMMLASIHEFGLTATGLVSKEELTQAVVDTACSLIHSDLASLMLLNANNELNIISSRGLSPKVVESTKIKIGEGIAGRVISTGKHIFVENIETDIRFLRPNDAERYISKSFISVPLRVKNKVIGVLNINSPKTKKQFDDRDVKLLTILADQAAMTLDNMELFNNLQSFYFEMVQTLARAIDAKDSYTYDHADRAGKYAKAIAKKMNLPYTIVRHVEYAALMHDIGKIGIADNILSKPGKLSDEEQEVIRKHPSIGHRIIAPVQFLMPVAPMVLYHQEWFDGSGYPEGLSGEEIPLGARIVAVIDAYDAITSNRPYRKALTQEAAINELKKGSGKQFDPKIVDIFINILSQETND
ncbi:MAG: GAF domain-containing protein [Endomicrobiaceae bacterium]|jgi:HD-GYP domain-containing protein (c-di-GMP phosphodiesterase class II)/competence protein ComGC|nr:GAF domain-containing protein [Endomicrobiaceae bacterium]